MKRGLTLLVLLLTISLAVVGFSSCSSDKSGDKERAETSTEAPKNEVPKEIQAVKDNVIRIAEENAKKLDGDWGDQHADLVKSGKKEKYKDFDKMRSELEKIRKDSGADYVYTLYPSRIDAEEPFFITVDGSKEPNAYGNEYDWEIQFKEAWEGTPAAARSA